MTSTAHLSELAARAAEGKPELIRAAVRRLEAACNGEDEAEATRWFEHLQALNKAWGVV